MTTETSQRGAAAVESAIRNPRRNGRPAAVAFLTGGYPDMERFAQHLVDVSRVADVIEVGIPFRDPMADGVSIQRSSHTALDNGASLQRILETIQTVRGDVDCPVLLMSYLNPLLNRGFGSLGDAAVEAGVDGFIVPDFPIDESGDFRSAMGERGLACVQLVTPVTTPERLEALVNATTGFLYAVSVTGITGAAIDADAVARYLDTVRAGSRVPVCCGFGIRERQHVERLNEHVDGVIVGTALIDAIERGDSPAAFLADLMGDERN